jgi:hypothetical protein
MSKFRQVVIATNHFIPQADKRLLPAVVRRGLESHKVPMGRRFCFSGDDSLPGLKGGMPRRIRNCIECPKCRTRYLVGFSPYRNGSYLVPLVEGFCEEWTLYCSCGRPPTSSRWNWNELKMYAVSNQAHDRGYGPPGEIVSLAMKSRVSSEA